jgi:hypothetical protein
MSNNSLLNIEKSTEELKMNLIGFVAYISELDQSIKTDPSKIRNIQKFVFWVLLANQTFDVVLNNLNKLIKLLDLNYLQHSEILEKFIYNLKDNYENYKYIVNKIGITEDLFLVFKDEIYDQVKNTILSNLNDEPDEQDSFDSNDNDSFLSIKDPEDEESEESLSRIFDNYKPVEECKKRVIKTIQTLFWKYDGTFDFKSQLPSIDDIVQILEKNKKVFDENKVFENVCIVQFIDSNLSEEEITSIPEILYNNEKLKHEIINDMERFNSKDSIFVYMIDSKGNYIENLELRDPDAKCLNPFYSENIELNYYNINDDVAAVGSRIICDGKIINDKNVEVLDSDFTNDLFKDEVNLEAKKCNNRKEKVNNINKNDELIYNFVFSKKKPINKLSYYFNNNSNNNLFVQMGEFEKEGSYTEAFINDAGQVFVSGESNPKLIIDDIHNDTIDTVDEHIAQLRSNKVICDDPNNSMFVFPVTECTVHAHKQLVCISAKNLDQAKELFKKNFKPIVPDNDNSIVARCVKVSAKKLDKEDSYKELIIDNSTYNCSTKEFISEGE